MVIFYLLSVVLSSFVSFLLVFDKNVSNGESENCINIFSRNMNVGSLSNKVTYRCFISILDQYTNVPFIINTYNFCFIQKYK